MLSATVKTHKEKKEKKQSYTQQIETDEQTKRKTLLLLSVKAPMTCKHLLHDLAKLLSGHTSTDSKIKEKFSLKDVLEVADMNDSNNVFLIETRKKSPAPILWAVTQDTDPETGKQTSDVIKFILTGVYTMKELRFLGNPLANTQMITLFSKEFDSSKGLKRARVVLNKIFNTTTEKKEEPTQISEYTDKIASFFILDKQIMARFYHIAKRTVETEKIIAERKRKDLTKTAEQKDQEEKDELENPEKKFEEELDPNVLETISQNNGVWYEITEVGPRFSLHPRETDLDDNYKEPEELQASQ
ncbi:ribosome biogenesis protein BRX1 [Nematocida sp. AWRm80]|nr:ribosome biogenesis protein BRX1 [Nematocida sp. AWRm80]